MCWPAAVAQPGSVKQKPAGGKNHCLSHAETLHRVIRLNRISLARLAQSAERKALNLVVVGSSPTVGVFCSTQNGFLEQGEWFQQSFELLHDPVEFTFQSWPPNSILSKDHAHLLCVELWGNSNSLQNKPQGH